MGAKPYQLWVCAKSYGTLVTFMQVHPNLLRLQDRQQNLKAGGNGRRVISIASGKIRQFNAHLLERFSRHLKLDFSAIKSSQAFADLCNYGAIAA